MFEEKGPRDWEIKDEEPPEKLQKKWDREESLGTCVVVCPSCKKETPAGNLACIFCGTVLPQGSCPAPCFFSRIKPVYDRYKKAIIPVVVLTLTCILAAALLRTIGTILDQYKQAGVL